MKILIIPFFFVFLLIVLMTKSNKTEVRAFPVNKNKVQKKDSLEASIAFRGKKKKRQRVKKKQNNKCKKNKNQKPVSESYLTEDLLSTKNNEFLDENLERPRQPVISNANFFHRNSDSKFYQVHNKEEMLEKEEPAESTKRSLNSSPKEIPTEEEKDKEIPQFALDNTFGFFYLLSNNELIDKKLIKNGTLQFHPKRKLKYVGNKSDNDETFTELSQLTQRYRLCELNLQNSNVTNNGLYNLKQIQGLESLDLSFCKKFGRKGMVAIANVRSLKKIDFTSCNVTDTVIEPIAELPLETLNLSETQITNRGLSFVSRLHSLTHLHLRGCKIDDMGIKNLNKLFALTNLNLADCNISDNSLSLIGKIKTLERLSLYNCQKITGKGIKHLINLRKLKVLDIRLCDLRKKALVLLKKHLPNLKIIGLGQTIIKGKVYVIDDHDEKAIAGVKINSYSISGNPITIYTCQNSSCMKCACNTTESKESPLGNYYFRTQHLEGFKVVFYYPGHSGKTYVPVVYQWNQEIFLDPRSIRLPNVSNFLKKGNPGGLEELTRLLKELEGLPGEELKKIVDKINKMMPKKPSLIDKFDSK